MENKTQQMDVIDVSKQKTEEGKQELYLYSLRKMAEDSGNDRFLEGVRIIEESYQPSITRRYIRAQRKNPKTGAWVNIPLGITDVDLLPDNEAAPEPDAEAEGTEAEAAE